MTASQNRRYSGHSRPQRKRATKEFLEKRHGERNVDSRIQVQLEKDGGGSARQSWMETSGLWPICFTGSDKACISQVKSVSHINKNSL